MAQMNKQLKHQARTSKLPPPFRTMAGQGQRNFKLQASKSPSWMRLSEISVEHSAWLTSLFGLGFYGGTLGDADIAGAGAQNEGGAAAIDFAF